MPYLGFSRMDLGAMKRRCESEYHTRALFGSRRRTVKKAEPGGPSRIASPTFRSWNIELPQLASGRPISNVPRQERPARRAPSFPPAEGEVGDRTHEVDERDGGPHPLAAPNLLRRTPVDVQQCRQ